MMINTPGVNEFIDLADAPHSYSGQATKVVKVNAGETAVEFGDGGGGTGTVTDVSVTTANGVSGSVTTSTTTPAITLTLGDITPSSVASVGSVTGSNLSGTNTGDNATNTQYSGLAASKQDVLTGLTASVSELNYTDGVTSAIQTQLDAKLDDTQFSGLAKISVGTSAPVAPATGDLWVDTN